MATSRRLAFVVFCILGAALAWACVGDDPAPGGSPETNDSGASSSGTTSSSGTGSSSGTTSSSGGSSGTDASGCATGIMCDGTCVDDKTDKKNCGRCTHDCGSGDCAAGVCKQVLLAGDSMADGGTVVTSIATDQTSDNPKALAQRVFWSVSGTGNGVFQDTVQGGNTVKLSTSAIGSTTVVVDSSTVYWFGQNFGGPPQPVLKGTVNSAGSQTGVSTMNANFLNAITYDAANKNIVGSYKASSTTFGAFKCGPTNGTVTCGALGATFTGAVGGNVAIDAANIYYLAPADGLIIRDALSGGNSGAYSTTEASPVLVRVDGMNLFWANSGDKKINRSSLGSKGAVTPLATAANEPSGLAADAVNVYWTDSTLGTVNYAPRTGSGPNSTYVTLGPSSSPMRLVRDTGFLYFSHNGGIYRVALP